jgi:hypothetical protein
MRRRMIMMMRRRKRITTRTKMSVDHSYYEYLDHDDNVTSTMTAFTIRTFPNKPKLDVALTW